MSRRKGKKTESAKQRRERRQASAARRAGQTGSERQPEPKRAKRPTTGGQITLTRTAKRFDPDPSPFYVAGLPDPERKYEP
jgi:hypothetical protein